MNALLKEEKILLIVAPDLAETCRQVGEAGIQGPGEAQPEGRRYVSPAARVTVSARINLFCFRCGACFPPLLSRSRFE